MVHAVLLKPHCNQVSYKVAKFHSHEPLPQSSNLKDLFVISLRSGLHRLVYVLQDMRDDPAGSASIPTACRPNAHHLQAMHYHEDLHSNV